MAGFKVDLNEVKMLRTGRKVGRTLYYQVGSEPSDADILIGIMDTPELAQMVVMAVNINPYLMSGIFNE